MGTGAAAKQTFDAAGTAALCLAGARSQRGQTLVESATIMGFVAVLTLVMLSALSVMGGGAFTELGGVLGADDGSVSSGGSLLPRIAD